MLHKKLLLLTATGLISITFGAMAHGKIEIRDSTWDNLSIKPTQVTQAYFKCNNAKLAVGSQITLTPGETATCKIYTTPPVITRSYSGSLNIQKSTGETTSISETANIKDKHNITGHYAYWKYGVSLLVAGTSRLSKKKNNNFSLNITNYASSR